MLRSGKSVKSTNWSEINLNFIYESQRAPMLNNISNSMRSCREYYFLPIYITQFVVESSHLEIVVIHMPAYSVLYGYKIIFNEERIRKSKIIIIIIIITFIHYFTWYLLLCTWDKLCPWGTSAATIFEITYLLLFRLDCGYYTRVALLFNVWCSRPPTHVMWIVFCVLFKCSAFSWLSRLCFLGTHKTYPGPSLVVNSIQRQHNTSQLSVICYRVIA